MKLRLQHDILHIKKAENEDLDALLQQLQQSRKARYFLYQKESIKVNESICRQNQKLSINDEIQIRLPKEQYQEITPDYQELEVCYEDELFLIVNKPAHLLVHSDGIDTTHTLSNRVQGYYHLQGSTAPIRPLHRLDKETSGLVLFCKLPFFQPILDMMMKEKMIHREYEAIVEGNLHQKKQTITFPIARDRHDAHKMRLSPNGKAAKTIFTLQKNYQGYAWLHARLYTGRTHQIRLHAAAIKHPLLSDALYGTLSAKIPRLALHASSLTFYHPLLNKELCVQCEVPADIKCLIK